MKRWLVIAATAASLSVAPWAARSEERVFAESSGRIQGMKAQESCAFVSELDFGEGFDLASEMDDKSGEATSATLGFVLLPGFLAGTDGMRRFR